jgi:HD superfamily phosphohydrolase
MASLLHDVGHGPLSHTTEFAMPDLKKLSMPEILGSLGKQNRQATHEDYTLKILLDSDLTPLLEKFGKSYGLKPIHIASLIDPAIKIEDEFFNCDFQGHKKVNFRPVLSQIISSELDADRMDYLRRDSTHTGTSYGQFDFEWLVSNLTAHIKDSKCFMALEHKALYSFEDFLLSRFHMFLMVYFHYKSVIYDEMLKQYFQAKDCDYALPFAIDEYATCDDSHLLQHLKKSKNTWAKRIVEKRPYRMLIELHSGIPATKTSQTERARVLAKLEKDLSKKDVHYIVAKTTGELSKYFNKPKHPIWVRYDDHFSKPIFIPLEKCTDLFERYQEKRLITRLYVAPEFRAEFQAEGRLSSIQYEDLPG